MKSLPILLRWLTVATLVFLSHLFSLTVVQAHHDHFEPPLKVLQEHRERILTLSSDQEAIAFHEGLMAKLSQTSPFPMLQKPSNHISQKIQETITIFWAAMAAIGHIQKLQAISDSPQDNHVFLDHGPTDAQRAWIQSKPSLQKFKDLLEILKNFSKSPPETSITLPLDVKTQAYETAWNTWHRIQQWHQQEQTSLAKLRICGTWKWIIHNHQNHGDQKTTITFSPPGLTTPSQTQPTTILIHGDTVYLKWIFPQGIQEDSLLLSNRDSRLEGTFTNSLGPHGSISGQRLSPCQN